MNEHVLKRNNVKVTGKGDKTLLFIHGYGCDQSMWRLVTPAFEANYQVVLLDLVGCGKSDEKAYDYDKYSTLQGYTDDLLEVCEALELKNVTLVGHSISGNISILASIARKDIFENLILICPSPRFINTEDYHGGFDQTDIDELIEALDSNYLGWSKAISPVIMGNPEKPELALELEESFCVNNPKIAKHFAKVTFFCDNREDLEKVDIKTLVIQCAEDSLAAVGVGEFVNSKIKGSELTVLNTNGHCPHLSNPNETIQAMTEFLLH